MPRPPKTRQRPRKRPQQQRAEVTVDSILAATARILVARGWSATTTNHVAARAGVSIGTLYEWFPNKEALVTALVERHLEQAEALLSTRAASLAARASTLTAEEIAEALVGAMVELHADAPALHRVLFEEVPHSAAMRARIRGLEEQLVDGLAALFMVAPAVRARDPRLAARLLADLLEAATHRWATDRAGAPVPREALTSELVRLVTAYLAT